MKLWIGKTRKITCRLLRVRASSETFIMTVVANALALLVNLPPHGSRRMTCSLSKAQGKTLQKSDLTVRTKPKPSMRSAAIMPKSVSNPSRRSGLIYFLAKLISYAMLLLSRVLLTLLKSITSSSRTTRCAMTKIVTARTGNH